MFAVASPGIYTLAARAASWQMPWPRLVARPDADLDRINKAAPLQDSMQVFVPHVAPNQFPQ